MGRCTKQIEVFQYSSWPSITISEDSMFVTALQIGHLDEFVLKDEMQLI